MRQMLGAMLVLVVLGVMASCAAPPVVVDDPTPEAVADFVRASFEEARIPGMAVTVTHGSEIIYSGGTGRDSEAGPVTADTPMRVASLTKSVTALTVLRGVEHGQIELDVPVVDQLPTFTLADPRVAMVTPRHLLHQTSGLVDTLVDLADLNRATTITDYVARLADTRLATQPGARYAYSNVNYEVLAALVEYLTGRPFAQVVTDEVLAPLGMRSSGIGDSGPQPALGYQDWYGLFLPRQESEMFSRGGSAGLVTTSSDLTRWLRYQATGQPRLVDRSVYEAMHAPPRDGSSPYAMGWQVEDGGHTISHNGLMFTYRAQQIVDLQTGWAVAVMANSSSAADPAAPIARSLMALVTGLETTPTDGGRGLTQGLLLLSTISAIVGGVIGIVRARRWSGRRHGRSRVITVLRLSWLIFPGVLLILTPRLVTFLSNGRVISWVQLTYFTGSILSLLTVATGAAAAVLIRRLHTLADAA